MINIRSIVMVTTTIGKSATARPPIISNFWVAREIPNIISTTSVKIAASRGTISSLKRIRPKRASTPPVITSRNKAIPQISRVSRKASAMRTGMKIPKVCKPMILRKKITSKAPSGTVNRIR